VLHNPLDWKYFKILELTGGNIDSFVHWTKSDTAPKSRGLRESADGRLIQRGMLHNSLPTLFERYREYLIMKSLDEVEQFKIGERIFKKIRFPDDTANIAKSQVMLYGMVNWIL